MDIVKSEQQTDHDTYLVRTSAGIQFYLDDHMADGDGTEQQPQQGAPKWLAQS